MIFDMKPQRATARVFVFPEDKKRLQKMASMRTTIPAQIIKELLERL
jgi:hypothetical protein